MSSIFDKFDKSVDIAGLQADAKEAAERGSDFKEVPHGTYEVSIEKMELTESKKGDPMVTCWFKVLAGEYAKSMIFMNQVITQGFQIHIVNEFLRSLGTNVAIDFEKYAQYEQLVMDVDEAQEGCEYVLEYGENKKGYSTFKIKEVFETEEA